MPNVRLTIDPTKVVFVTETEYRDLLAQKLIFSLEGGDPVDYPDFSPSQYAELVDFIATRGPDQLAIGVVAGWLKAPMIVGRGHSFIEGTGLTASAYWAALFAATLGRPYTNNGKGNTTAEDAAWRMWSSLSYSHVPGSKVDTIIESMINSLRLNGSDAATRRGVEYSLRTMITLAFSKALFTVDSGRFTFGSTGWAGATTSGNYPGGKYRGTLTTATGIGAYVEFTTTTPANGTSLLTLARRSGISAGRTEIRRMDTNAVLLDWDNRDNAAFNLNTQFGAWQYAPAAIPIDAPAGTVIRVTNLSPDGTAVGSTTICGLLERDPDTKNRVIIMKEPKLANYAASTSFPNGSDEAVDYFNTLADTLAAENSSVAAVNPEPWWTKVEAASLVQDDQVHPNAEGNRRLSRAAIVGAAKKALSTLWA